MKKDEVALLEETNTNSIHTHEKFDPYQFALKYEDEELKIRTEEDDQEQFGSICKQIRNSMKEILKCKNDKNEKTNSLIEEKKVQVLMQMLSLRRLSRIQKVRVKESREKTVESRQGVDGVTLKLQNLLYEVSHLKKEVRRCLEFESADKEIDLIPIDQFYKDAPETICRPEETVDNPHEQRLAQLHWELEQRRGQTQLFDQLTQEKERVATIISEQEIKLSSLAPRINAILEVTRPLQEALDLPLDQQKEQQEQSCYLPVPLYTLWVQANAYQEACDSLLKVQIQGDLDAARKLVTPIEDDKAEASDSETELDPQEDNLTRKSRNKKEKLKSDTEDSKENCLQQLLALHPLHIVMTVQSRDGNNVVIKFFYATNLKVVTTKCTMSPLIERAKSQFVDVLEGKSFLNCLFPEDVGCHSPNPSNLYQLNKVGLSQLSCAHLSMIGKPYKWAQTLAGLSFIDPEPIIQPPELSHPENGDLDISFERKESEDDQDKLKAVDSSKPGISKASCECISWRMSAEHMHDIIIAIRRRLQARTALHNQLIPLETASTLSSVPLAKDALDEHFPRKISTELRSWRPITWADYQMQPCTKGFINAGFATEDHFTFKATFERQAVKLDAYISISPDYPNLAPIFALSLKWGEHLNSAISSQIKQMESEVNVHWHEIATSRKDRLGLLSLQIYRLAMCLDIFTEALTSQSEGPESQNAFHKEKIFFRAARGPDRALPFKYLPKLGVFAQR